MGCFEKLLEYQRSLLSVKSESYGKTRKSLLAYFALSTILSGSDFFVL